MKIVFLGLFFMILSGSFKSFAVEIGPRNSSGSPNLIEMDTRGFDEDCELLMQNSDEHFMKDLHAVYRLFEWMTMEHEAITTAISNAQDPGLVLQLENLLHVTTGFYIMPEKKSSFLHRKDNDFKSFVDALEVKGPMWQTFFPLADNLSYKDLIAKPIFTKQPGTSSLTAEGYRARREFITHLLANTLFLMDQIANVKTNRQGKMAVKGTKPIITVNVKIPAEGANRADRWLRFNLESLFSVTSLEQIGNLSRDMESPSARRLAFAYLDEHLADFLAANEDLSKELAAQPGANKKRVLLGTRSSIRQLSFRNREAFFARLKKRFKEKEPSLPSTPASLPANVVIAAPVLERPKSQITVASIDTFLENSEKNVAPSSLTDFSASNLVDQLHVANGLVNHMLSQLPGPPPNNGPFKSWWTQRQHIENWISDFANLIRDRSRSNRENILGLEEIEVRLGKLNDWCTEQMAILENLDKSKDELAKLSISQQRMLATALKFSRNTSLNIQQSVATVHSRLNRESALLDIWSDLEISMGQYHRQRMEGLPIIPDELPLIKALYLLAFPEQPSDLTNQDGDPASEY
jgi:hypothetical protein